MIKKSLITCLFITSCSGLPSLDYYSGAKESFKYITGRNNFSVSSNAYAQEEYSFIKVKLGRSTPIIMVLAYVNDGIFEWVGPDQSKIYTYKGKIIELSGFKNDIKIQHPRSKIKNFLTKNSKSYSVDFYSPTLLNLDIISSYSQDSKMVSMFRLDGETSFIRIQEKISAPLIGWKAKNYYYYGEDEAIFKTIQHAHPRMPVIEIEFYIK